MRLDRNNVRERMKDTLMQTLQISFVENDDNDTIEATMPVGLHNVQTMQVLHGGATIALAESVAGVGSNIYCEENESCYGIQISANHVSHALMGDVVKAVGTVVHKGRSTHVWNVDVFSESTGKLISSIRVTNFVAKKR